MINAAVITSEARRLTDAYITTPEESGLSKGVVEGVGTSLIAVIKMIKIITIWLCVASLCFLISFR